MSDHSELKRLAESCIGVRGFELIDKLAEFNAAANPIAVLALLYRQERISSRLCMCRDCAGQGEIYSGHSTSQGYNQPPEPDMDVCGTCGGEGVIGPVEDFEDIAAERDQLKTDNDVLSAKYELARDRNNSIVALQVEVEQLKEDLVIFKAGTSALGGALKNLIFCARTVMDGPDHALISACDSAENSLSLVGVSRSIDYIEGLKAESDALRKDVERYKWLSVEGNWVARMFGKWRAHAGEYGDSNPTDWFDTREEAIDAAMSKGDQP